MAKKIKIYISIFLCLIICLPSIPAHAEGEQFFKAITSEVFLSQYSADDLAFVTPQFSRSQSYFEGYNYTNFNDISSFVVSPFSDNVVYVLAGFNSSTGNTMCTLIDFSNVESDYEAVFTTTGVTIKLYDTDLLLEEIAPTATVYTYRFDKFNTSLWTLDNTSTMSFTVSNDPNLNILDNFETQNGKQPVGLSYSSSGQDRHYYLNVGNSNMSYMYYTNCSHYYSINELWSKYYSPTADGNISNLFAMAMCNASNVGITDYLAGGFSSYFNGSEIITPDVPVSEETNANHMYFTNVDMGFCEPNNVNSFSNFGGAYFYVNYGVDDWVRSHISDYKLYFHVDCYVGSDHYSFTTREILDPDMCLTIPFSYFDGLNTGFTGYVTNQKIDKNFLKTFLYCVKPSSYNNFYQKLSTGDIGNTLSNALSNLTNSNTSRDGFLTYITNSRTIVVTDQTITSDFTSSLFYNTHFEFNVSCKLIDTNNNESGLVSRNFDIVRGSDIATDNSGLTNEDPYISDDDKTEFLPDLPSDYDIIYPDGTAAVNVYNMTPNEIKLKIDTGFEKFVEWVNNHGEGEIASNYFWGTLTGNFEDNPATELYSDYFGFLPADLKTLIFAVLGISFVGSGFCILRKNLRG